MVVTNRAARVLAVLCLGLTLCLIPTRSAATERGFVESTSAENTALLVSVGHGLSGLDIDIRNVQEMIGNPAYNFKHVHLDEGQGTVSGVTKELTQGARDAKEDGTFFFYYTGHGGVGTIWLQDTSMNVKAIRAALEAGRKDIGPMSRLVLIYDSCHAGSMMDPMRPWFGTLSMMDDRGVSALIADSLVEELAAPTRDGLAAPYWQKLMVIASSTASESSLASSAGSIFTLAMKKAYDEALATHATVGNFFQKSQEYTQGHHPVARFVPADLVDEKMIP